MRVREPMGARCTRPARTTAVLALSLVLMASAQVEFAAATPNTEARTVAGPGLVAAATAAVSATADTGVPPTVHELAVPTVPRAERAETAESTGSRAALVAKSALPKSAAASPSLVAHVEAPVAGGFSMLGVTWSRTGDLSRAAAPIVAVRTKEGGSWSRWTEASVDPDEGPSAAEESERPRRHRADLRGRSGRGRGGCLHRQRHRAGRPRGGRHRPRYDACRHVAVQGRDRRHARSPARPGTASRRSRAS